MDDVVERMARAICIGKGGRPDDTWFDEGARTVRREWERFEKEARSALFALRPGDLVPAGVVAPIEPNEAMENAAGGALCSALESRADDPLICGAVYRAVIAAIKEPPHAD